MAVVINLFGGPGAGKSTTMARLFAKALNCENGFGHQCNMCENCKKMCYNRIVIIIG